MTKKSYVVENGLTLGLIGLAVLVVFAIGLPRWTHHQDFKAIKLPATLSDGYTLLTTTAVPAGVPPQTVQNAIDGLNKLDASVTGASGTASRTAFYLSAGGGQLAVQVVRGGGSAPLVMPLIAPGSYSKVGDDICFTPQSSGSQQTTVTETCRRSSADFTIQIAAVNASAGAVSAADTAKYLDQIFSKVS